MNTLASESWLPGDKTAAVCFSIDDVHPGTSRDYYEAGGDLGIGALGLVQWLIRRHPQLIATLFTTADWREIRPFASYPALERIPVISGLGHRMQTRPKGLMALDRHPAFIDFLRSEPRFEIGLHGLYHIHPRRISPVEFQEQGAGECRAMLEEMLRIFDCAKLPFVKGMTPPGWNAPAPLLNAMADLGLDFVASARDIMTPVHIAAKANMSGLKDVDLYRPQLINGGRLVHIPANFQATSSIDRAVEIIEAGGLLSIKGHIVKSCFGHLALDGIDALYCNYLDTLFSRLEDRYGDSLWWTSMGEISARIKTGHQLSVFAPVPVAMLGQQEPGPEAAA